MTGTVVGVRDEGQKDTIPPLESRSMSETSVYGNALESLMKDRDFLSSSWAEEKNPHRHIIYNPKPLIVPPASHLT